ncbi:aspartyl-phosphate phosphatase Spo0E family protein [Paenibacillus aurantius]|uniref:Aspartyl-phosphate phosphatase Spo0E family protein n=1 Tax=Paenibacillus aurantius TaxID=2918900 RepID=A0AA96LJD5_9BACL|nr:aspartyl-phosphate phosphatase Spo0E family protein [Paenibacillus aurantius]WNQ14088.1 aspartyl-phosphate phosphatase Spo0E family protein [Paenibacillus aurantius]
MNLDPLELAIEQKRMEMNDASERFGLSSSIVLQLSQELDILLNQYKWNGFWKNTQMVAV